MAVVDLPILDLRDELVTLPRKRGASPQPRRAVTRFITFHYSAVAYQDRSRGAELNRIFSEARFHLTKNWGRPGKPVVYGDRYQYDYVVLSDGGVALCNDPTQLWHCNNKTGNRESASLHVMQPRLT